MSHDISSISSTAAMGHFFFTWKRVGLALSGDKKKQTGRIVIWGVSYVEVNVACS